MSNNFISEIKFVDSEDDYYDIISKINLSISSRLQNAIIVKIYSYHNDEHRKYLSNDVLDKIYMLVQKYDKINNEINNYENKYKILLEPFTINRSEIISYVNSSKILPMDFKKAIINKILNYSNSKKRISISHFNSEEDSKVQMHKNRFREYYFNNCNNCNVSEPIYCHICNIYYCNICKEINERPNYQFIFSNSIPPL